MGFALNKRDCIVLYINVACVFRFYRNAYHGGSPYTMGLTSLSNYGHCFPNGFGVHQVSEHLAILTKF